MRGMVTLIRHGQASFGAANYDELSQMGHKQAQLTAAKIAADKLASGSLKRHKETAAPFQMEAEVNAQWDEFDYLDVIRVLNPALKNQAAIFEFFKTDPNPKRAFQKLYLEALAKWTSGEHDDEYVESRPAFTSRVMNAFNAAISDANDGVNVVVCTSGGPIAAVLENVLETKNEQTRSFEKLIVNASITRFIVSRGRAQLYTFNDHAHLSAEGDEYVTFR